MMKLTQKEANKTKPCDARLSGYERTTGGTPVPVVCTRPLGHIGHHSDQRDGVYLDWNSNDHLATVYGFRISTNIGKEELRNVLRKLVNLAGHPYFPEVKDLPAWGDAIQEARNIL
jgi:hypothetical protein